MSTSEKSTYPDLAEIWPTNRKRPLHGQLHATDMLSEQRRLRPPTRAAGPRFAPEKRPCLLATTDDGRYLYIRFAADGSRDTDSQVMRRLAALLTERADELEAAR
jgi:hypothetical protein